MHNKKYWLRGGIIMVLLAAIATFVIMIAVPDKCTPAMWLCFPPWGIVVLLPFVLVHPFDTHLEPLYSFMNRYFFHNSEIGLYVGSALLYFFIGVLLGWIYGKIKNRNKALVEKVG